MGLRTSGLSQPKMITRQHCTWLIPIAGSRSGAPGGVPLRGFQPTDQVPGSRSDRSRTGGRVGLLEVQAAYASDTSRRLGPYLYQIVPTRKCQRTASHGVLGSFRDGRPALLRSSGRSPGVTSHEPTPEQEDDPENLPGRLLASYPARDGEEPYHRIQAHVD
jgi:hypothetical protein